MGTRERLADSLTSMNRYVTLTRDAEDISALAATFPRGAQGVAIHQRLYIDTRSQEYCLDYTILDKSANPDKTYDTCLFLPGCVSTFIRKSKTNIVISELTNMAVQQGTFGTDNLFSNPLSTVLMGMGGAPYTVECQLSQLSQFSQMMPSVYGTDAEHSQLASQSRGGGGFI